MEHRHTCDAVPRPVGGSRGGQGEGGAAGGGAEGRVHGHQVATGKRHRAVGETHTFFHTAHTHEHEERRRGGFERHLEQADTAEPDVSLTQQQQQQHVSGAAGADRRGHMIEMRPMESLSNGLCEKQ